MIIHNLKKLSELVKEAKLKKKTIGLCHGVYDVLHSGHILHFEEAKKVCDILIVSITSDQFVNKGPNRPFLNQEIRSKILSSIKLIDYIYCNNELTPINLIHKIRPNFYIKGKDYKKSEDDLTNNLKLEISAINSVRGKFYTTESLQFSSSKIISDQFNLINNDFQKAILKVNKDNLKRQLKSLISSKINKKILIIGEPIIDEYTKVKILGKSAKNNIISTSFIKKNSYAGGSLLVANVLSNFFTNIDLLTFNKQSNEGSYNKLLNRNIKKIYINCDNKIIIKNRFLDAYSNERLFQINKNNIFSIKKKYKNSFLGKIKKVMKIYDKIIVLDFGHELFSKELVKLINLYSNKTIINCQSNSANFGFNLINKYKSGYTISMDEIEFRLGVNDKNNSIDSLIQTNKKLINKFNKFIITRGKLGSYLIDKKEKYYFPSLVKNPVDTTGSGDVFFSMVILASYLKKINNFDVSLLAHLGAGLHSLKLGNECVVNAKSIYKNICHLIP